MSEPYRIHFLDNLRAFVVLLVIVLHGTLTYNPYSPDWWYVLDAQNHWAFLFPTILIDVPIMPTMFFISGFFALPSLQKRGPVPFMKDKMIRIGIPWVLGVLLLSPPTTYMVYLSRKVPTTLSDFWRYDFWGIMYQQSVYWYLGLLMVFFGLLTLIFLMSKGLKEKTARMQKPSWLFFGGFTVVMIAGMVLLNQFFHLDQWNNLGYILYAQPARLLLYPGYFILGIIANQQGWFTQEGFKPDTMAWSTASILSGLFYLSHKMSPTTAVPDPGFLVNLTTIILFNLFCLSAMMAALSIFQKKWSKSGRLWSSLSASSYGMYYFHPLILYPLAYLFTFISLPGLLKGNIVILLGILLSWFFTSQIILKLPYLKKVF